MLIERSVMELSLQYIIKRKIVMKNNIKKLTTSAGLYPFYEILHDQTAKWLPYVRDSLTNSIFAIDTGMLGTPSILRSSKKSIG